MVKWANQFTRSVINLSKQNIKYVINESFEDFNKIKNITHVSVITLRNMFTFSAIFFRCLDFFWYAILIHDKSTINKLLDLFQIAAPKCS